MNIQRRTRFPEFLSLRFPFSLSRICILNDSFDIVSDALGRLIIYESLGMCIAFWDYSALRVQMLMRVFDKVKLSARSSVVSFETKERDTSKRGAPVKVEITIGNKITSVAKEGNINSHFLAIISSRKSSFVIGAIDLPTPSSCKAEADRTKTLTLTEEERFSGRRSPGSAGKVEAGAAREQRHRFPAALSNLCAPESPVISVVRSSARSRLAPAPASPRIPDTHAPALILPHLRGP